MQHQCCISTFVILLTLTFQIISSHDQKSTYLPYLRWERIVHVGSGLRQLTFQWLIIYHIKGLINSDIDHEDCSGVIKFQIFDMKCFLKYQNHSPSTCNHIERIWFLSDLNIYLLAHEQLINSRLIIGNELLRISTHGFIKQK